MTSYLQIIGALGWGLSITFPPAFRSFVSFTSSIVNLDFLNLMPLGCITTSDFHRRLVVMTLVPLLLGVMMVVAYKFFKAGGMKKRANDIFGWLLFLSFLVLPSVSMKCFQQFGCTKFDGGEERRGKLSRFVY
jgi:hypothetical protein